MTAPETSTPSVSRVSQQSAESVPTAKGMVFLEMPPNSLANGIRFDRKGLMYVARLHRS